MEPVRARDVEGSLRRLWVEFEPVSRGLGVIGVNTDRGDGSPFARGVSGRDAADCWSLVHGEVGAARPEVLRTIWDIDVSTLDPTAVLPAIGNPAHRGVWFPDRNSRPPS